jgi:hypothetical protein
MLNIDLNTFAQNLLITQKYCHLQQQGEEKDPAKIFRSINPLIDGIPFFSFKKENYNFLENHITVTDMSFDIYSPNFETLYYKIYEEQLSIKKTFDIDENHTFDGKIYIANLYDTIIDGASEVESFGFIDAVDLPPIDTWFYLLKQNNKLLFFAWIPSNFTPLAQNASDVNCVDCINWFSEWYPEDYQRVAKFLEQNIGFKRPEISSLGTQMTIWDKISNLFKK